eukprot:gene13367-28329_t
MQRYGGRAIRSILFRSRICLLHTGAVQSDSVYVVKSMPNKSNAPKIANGQAFVDSDSTAQIPLPSNEQQLILDAVNSKSDFNIAVNAVAGSGKTTTVLQLAEDNPDSTILLLTYNSRLKAETRLKVVQFGLKNLEVHSYHAFGVKYYDPRCHNTTKIIQITKWKKKHIKPLKPYDIVVIDEAQDMTPPLYSFLCKLLYDNFNEYKKSPQLILFGDENQELYSFNDADKRYLTLHPDVYKYMSLTSVRNERPWGTFSLQNTYRLPATITTFINQAMLGGEQRLIPTKTGPAKFVDYMIGSPWEAADKIAKYILHNLEEGIYEPKDIFILAPSLKFGKGKTYKPPFKYLENLLSEKGVPIYIPPGGDCIIKEEYAANKVIFSTFHQSKGLERELVVVFSFSKDYFDYFAKNSNTQTCPSPLYVAVTRAKSKLILVAENKIGNHLPFLTRDLILNELSQGPNACVRILSGTLYETFSSSEAGNEVNVKKLLRYIPNQLLSNIIPRLHWKCIRKGSSNDNNDDDISSSKRIKIPSDVDDEFTSHGGKESVAELNGIAIPALLEQK